MPKYYTRWDLSMRAQDAIDEARAAQAQLESGTYSQADDYARRAINALTAMRRGMHALRLADERAS